MTNDELLNALRVTVREEVNAAVYASEQRLGEQIKASEQRMGERLNKMDERLNRLEGMVIPMAEQMKLLRTAHRELKGDLLDIKTELTQAVLILNEATFKINDLQRSQVSLETRVEENIKGLWRDLQRMVATLQSFTKEFN